MLSRQDLSVSSLENVPQLEADLDLGPLIVDREETLPLDPKPSLQGAWDFLSPQLRPLVDGCVALIEKAAPGTEIRWIQRWFAFLLRTPPPRARLYGYLMVGKPPLRFGLELRPEDDPQRLFEPGPTARSRARLEVRELATLENPELASVLTRAYAAARAPKGKASKTAR